MKITLLSNAIFSPGDERSTMCCTIELPALPGPGDEITLPGFHSPFKVIGKREFYPGTGFIVLHVDGPKSPYKELIAKGWESYT
ncbi:hypothetical protein LCGC14_2894010 [marine sediment metagenome]|uniref:Uncharacterized protein n=1 Tax=marine sediment metagenome TaxID=412755 RepID=A0A0F9A4B0_9ZZZZ